MNYEGFETKRLKQSTVKKKKSKGKMKQRRKYL